MNSVPDEKGVMRFEVRTPYIDPDFDLVALLEVGFGLTGTDYLLVVDDRKVNNHLDMQVALSAVGFALMDTRVDVVVVDHMANSLVSWPVVI